jgi:hypothetical protein
VKRGNFWFGGGLALLCLSLVILALSCGGGGGGGGSSTGTVNTSISDPPTCQSTFPHVWVTITRVRAHTSANASESASGWSDLLDLRDHPKQIDLMNLSDTDCLLKTLASTSGIPAGQYQQIRLYLLSNDSPEDTELSEPDNKCAILPDVFNGFNCVVTSTGTQMLELSSEAQTGIKIPSGQIAGGKFVVPEGKEVDLNIDFDACSSIVQNNGQFRLKPVLHAAEISLSNPVKISGTVVDSKTGDRISGAVLFLEQPDSDGIDRMIMQTLSKPDGTFMFCPVPSGNFDVVADALVGNTAYNATITFGVPSGAVMGNIPIIAETGASTLPAEISGQITTTAASGATQAVVSVSALQSVTLQPENTTILVTIPLLGPPPAPNVTVTTQTDGCSSSTVACAQYTLVVPASNPSFKEFTDTGGYSDPAGLPINYTVNAQAADCSSSSLFIDPVTVQPGGTTTLDEPFRFTGCQP